MLADFFDRLPKWFFAIWLVAAAASVGFLALVMILLVKLIAYL